MHGEVDENENTEDTNGADDAEVEEVYRIFTCKTEAKIEIKMALFTKKLVSFEL
jgi:hypothetical protein